jgi:glycosyltransferase involved in cell wall biosynthesis
MQSQYLEASAVVFSSKLETWGLPLTEAKLYGIPLIVADLPYAHETVGTYDAVSFFPANKPEILANLMQDLIEKKWKPTGNIESLPSKPFAKNWSELLQMIVDDFQNIDVTSGHTL